MAFISLWRWRNLGGGQNETAPFAPAVIDKLSFLENAMVGFLLAAAAPFLHFLPSIWPLPPCAFLSECDFIIIIQVVDFSIGRRRRSEKTESIVGNTGLARRGTKTSNWTLHRTNINFAGLDPIVKCHSSMRSVCSVSNGGAGGGMFARGKLGNLKSDQEEEFEWLWWSRG